MAINTMIPPPPIVSPKTTPTAKTDDYTVTAADFSKLFTNTGAAKGITFTLPAASTMAGCSLGFGLFAAQTVTLDPGTGKIWLSGSGVADKTCIIAGAIGNYAHIYSDGVDWMVIDYSGVLTKEA